MSIEVKKYDIEGRELAIRFGLGGIKAVGVGMVEEMIKNRDKNGGFQDIYDFASKAGSKAVNKKSLEALAKSGAFDSIHQIRNQIVESVDIICKYATAKDEEKNSNQMSLFADSQIAEDKPTLKRVDDWELDKKLKEEFKAFGFFLNEHPIDNFLEALSRRGVISSENLEDLNDNNIVKLAGVVAYSKHKSGPKGRYAYLTLSDPFGIYETAIFDESIITLHRDLMADGSILVVECFVKKDQGSSRLLVKSMVKLEDFIKHNHPKKEAYKDIRQQEKRGDFDWKKRRKEKNDIKSDSVVQGMEYKRKIDELKNKKILNQIEITINNRQSLLQIKSFLSQRLAPQDFDSFTKVYFLIEDSQKNPQTSKVKIDSGGKYLLDENDLNKIRNIAINTN